MKLGLDRRAGMGLSLFGSSFLDWRNAGFSSLPGALILPGCLSF